MEKIDRRRELFVFFFNIELKTAMSKNVPAQRIYKLMKKHVWQIGKKALSTAKEEDFTLRKGQSSH
jgi:hypothetical protein